MPWIADSPVRPAEFAQVRLRTIFDCHKWDAQIGDIDMLAPFPIMLDASMWSELAQLAERLAQEVVDAEEELLLKPFLHDRLGLPRPIARLLKQFAKEPIAAQSIRLIRFDFHLTEDGWKISEANTDVPGGFIEASGFSRLMAQHYQGAALTGDPAVSLANALVEKLGAGASVALVHATSYTDDRQVMMFLAKPMEERGLKTFLVSPEHLVWENGNARLNCHWQKGQIDAVVRFFPANWLARLDSVPNNFFRSSHTLLCNPATALLTQSKRFPLTWDFLETKLETWRQLLPETVDPRSVDSAELDDWVLKPAWGREGDNILLPGVTPSHEREEIRRAALKNPEQWVAQRRFKALPLSADGQNVYPCFGVYTIDGKAAGTYGRIGARPIIDGKARDVAVFVRELRAEVHNGR